MRAFGNMLAEVPLIATRLDARRKGHARYLMTALEDLLAQVTPPPFHQSKGHARYLMTALEDLLTQVTPEPPPLLRTTPVCWSQGRPGICRGLPPW